MSHSQTVNQFDSIGNKVGLWICNDIEDIKFEIKEYSQEGILEYKKIFSRNGNEIINYNIVIDVNIINQIRKRIKQYFVMSDINEASGKTVSFLIIDCSRNIFEIRTTKGITKYFDEEYLKATRLAEKDLKLMSDKLCMESYVIPFTVAIYGK
jgi:hypothetical protein